MKRNFVNGVRGVWFYLPLLVALLFSASTGARLNAQVVGGTLTGTITDASGASIANAAVAIQNTDTGVGRTVNTNDAGLYTAPNLQPGPYKVTTTATGFAPAAATVTLTVGAVQTLNMNLKVGASTQTVEVTDVAPTVDLADSSLGGLNNEVTVTQLPLNGRSWTDLATLQPGVNALHAQAVVTSSDRFSRGLGDQITISGARPEQNNYRLNGISINDPTNGGPGSVLGGNMGVDAISEFSILTTNYAAEYGRASGGIINAVTKSGTNTWHGDGYEFLRNSALDAKNYFDLPSPTPIPPFRRNQFGASAGGPIRKDKTFIFGDYEGLRQFLSITQQDNVPTQAARNGILAAGGPPVASCPAGDPNGYVIPVPGQTNTCVDKQALRYLNAFWPLPSPGSAIKGDSGVFTFPLPQVSSENYFTIRADNKLGDRDNLDFVMFYDYSSTLADDPFENLSEDQLVHRQYYTLEESHVFSSTMLNDLRLGTNRYNDGAPGSVTAINPAAADTSFGFQPGQTAGGIGIGGNFKSFPGGTNGVRIQTHTWDTYQVDDDFQVTRGKNTIKFGGAIERDYYSQFTNAGMPDGFTFNSFANFLLNNPFSVGVTSPNIVPQAHTVQNIFGLYLQDDMHLRSNLTINIGLRYEPASVPREMDQAPSFPGITNNTGVGLVSNLYSLTNTATQTHVGNPLFQNNTLTNLAPRFGFAWDPFKKGTTSIRGGFGFYDEFLEASYFYQAFNQLYPLQLQGAVTNPTAFGFPVTAITNGINGLISNPVTARPQYVQPVPPPIYVEQWNASVSHEIVKNLTVLVAYVGTHGVHGEEVVDNADIVEPMVVPGVGDLWPCESAAFPFSPTTGCSTAAGAPYRNSANRINPNLGGFKAAFFGNSSTYRALQFQVTKRMTHGFQAQGSFTWSNSKDEASGGLIGDQFTNGLSNGLYFADPSLTHANSDYNIPRTGTFNFTWDIPSPKNWGKFVEKGLGGWELGSIFTASDGLPFTPIMNGDSVGSFISGNDYPDLSGASGCSTLTNPGNPSNYLKTQCFTPPPAVVYNGVHYLRFGNAGRNVVQGPGLIDLDFSVIKNTYVPRISETFNVQFRAEMFNILNHPNFLPPVDNSVIFDTSVAGRGIGGPAAAAADLQSGVGAVDSPTATTSRQIQFAVKVIW